MKILIVLVSFCAEGTPVLALQLCRHWQAAGHQLHLLVLQSAPADLRSEFEQLGVRIDVLRLGRGSLRYLRILAGCWRLCRRWHPDAVLSMPLGWHAFIAWGAYLAGVPCTVAHAGNLPPVWTGRAFAKFRALVQLGRPVTRRLICCSEYVRSATIRDFGVSSDEAITVYNACDLARFTPAEPSEQRSSSEGVRLGVVGRLDENRDYPTLIRAVGLLRDRGVAAELWLIGEGQGRSALEALILQLDLAQHVRLLGMRRDIPALLHQLDLFVWPALDLEGFGIALAEAMAAAVPIVASDVGACREVLDAGRCGLLAPPGDPEALARAIEAVLADPAGALQRVHAAQQRAQDLFSVEAMADAYLEAMSSHAR